jgi:predicted metal-dependent HD superfamily phosphohydrolase
MDADWQEALRERWRRLVRGLTAVTVASDAAFDELASCYAEAARHYHTLKHVVAVLDVIETNELAPPELSLAGWYHDAIYDAKADDNEARSADFAREELAKIGIPQQVTYEVGRLVLLTKTHNATACDITGQLLLDADLSVLGADARSYDSYAAAIRREYSWVPEEHYRSGRCRVLQSFLARDRIYWRLTHLEQAARRNLSREIQHLATG